MQNIKGIIVRLLQIEYATLLWNITMIKNMLVSTG